MSCLCKESLRSQSVAVWSEGGGRTGRMAQEFVNSKIRSDKVTVFGKPSCPYCHKAVEFLEELGVKHLEYVDLTTRADMSNIQDYLLRTTGARTVPRIYIGETCIGGYDNLTALHSRGELIPILKQIGAL